MRGSGFGCGETFQWALALADDLAEKKKENAVLARAASNCKELALGSEFGHAGGNRAACVLVRLRTSWKYEFHLATRFEAISCEESFAY
jgi:hypothetical protein